jgi:hypothetical protein
MANAGPCDATLVGVIPARIVTGPGLSAAVRSAAGAAAEAVVAELERLGATARVRGDEVTIAPWWEQPTALA